MGSETGASGVLCASHRDPQSGALHGHTWTVTIRVAAEPKRDARVLQEWLKRVLGAWDHTVLPDELASGEALAEVIGKLHGDALEVMVSRPAEGLFAWWRP